MPEISFAEDLLGARGFRAGPARQLREIGNRYLRETYARFPQWASRDGLHDRDGELGANDAAAHQAQIALCERTLAEVESIPSISLEGDDWLDRRGFLSLLRTHLFNERDRGRWRNNPQSHPSEAMDAVFLLFVRAGDRLAEASGAIVSRLERVPAFLDAGARGIRRPVPLWVKLAEETCQGAVEFLEGISPVLEEASADAARAKSAIGSACRAFADYAKTIGRRAMGGTRDYAAGSAGFEFLLRERNGLDWSVAETVAVGTRLVEQMEAALEVEAKRFGKRPARAVLEEAREEWMPGGPLIDVYRRETLRIREALRKGGLVPMPRTERLKVLPVPAFLRNQFPTAAYHAPGAFDPDQTGIFWVNDLASTMEDAAGRKRETAQHFGLELTCAHEAYPGHHLQFIIQNRHKSRLRRLFAHGIFYEGWTLWCERLTVELGLCTDPRARLLQLHDALWRAHRVVIDAGLHSGAMSYAQACKRLVQGVGFTPARARGDVNWYTQLPTVPMSYLCGRLEVERLHARLVGREGWTLREFHDWLLGHGAIPWSWIAAASSPVKPG